MQFKTSSLRNQHEDMLHKNLFEKSVERLITHIISSHTEEESKKPVFNLSDRVISYHEIASLDKKSSEYKQVEATLKKLIHDWVENTPNTTVEDFFRRARFRINGKS